MPGEEGSALAGIDIIDEQTAQNKNGDKLASFPNPHIPISIHQYGGNYGQY